MVSPSSGVATNRELHPCIAGENNIRAAAVLGALSVPVGTIALLPPEPVAISRYRNRTTMILFSVASSRWFVELDARADGELSRNKLA
jgi:ArsR family metal-binding transcriptional regulator